MIRQEIRAIFFDFCHFLSSTVLKKCRCGTICNTAIGKLSGHRLAQKFLLFMAVAVGAVVFSRALLEPGSETFDRSNYGLQYARRAVEEADAVQVLSRAVDFEHCFFC